MTGYYNDGNEEDAEIIIVLRERERKRSERPVLLCVLEAVHATFPPEFQKQRPLLELQGDRTHSEQGNQTKSKHSVGENQNSHRMTVFSILQRRKRPSTASHRFPESLAGTTKFEVRLQKNNPTNFIHTLKKENYG